MTGVVILLVAVVLALGAGLVLRWRDGRFRTVAVSASRPGRPARAAGPTVSATAGPGDQTGAGALEPARATDATGKAGSAGVTGSELAVEAVEAVGVGGSAGVGEDPAPAERVGPARPGVVTGPVEGLAAELAALGETAGERATLLQFSTAFCAPCRSTRQVLAGVAGSVPGVRHVEVDAEAHLDLVRRLAVRRTPTVLILDGHGREVRRASGAPPSRGAVLATLAEIVAPEGTKRASGDSSDSSSSG